MITKNDFPILSNFPPVKTCKHFIAKKDDSFSAVTSARTLAKKRGFAIGSMCSDEPIALAKGLDYIAKWYNIDRNEWPKIEGMLLSNDFRDGDVYFVEFAK